MTAIEPESADFDLFSEFWQRSAASAQAKLTAAAGAELREDKYRFQDESKQCAARATERLLAGPARGIDPTPTYRRALFFARDPGVRPAAFLDALATWGPTLMTQSIVRVTLDAISPLNEARFPFDAILSLWLGGRDGAQAAVTPPQGARMAALAILDTRETPPEQLAIAERER